MRDSAPDLEWGGAWSGERVKGVEGRKREEKEEKNSEV
jgi:hypothetical protein